MKTDDGVMNTPECSRCGRLVPNCPRFARDGRPLREPSRYADLVTDGARFLKEMTAMQLTLSEAVATIARWRKARDAAEAACSTWAREAEEAKRDLAIAREQVKLAEAEMAEQRRARILAENERAKTEEKYQAVLIAIGEIENLVSAE